MNKEKSKNVSKSNFTILEEMKNINIPNESLKPIEKEIDIVSMFQKLKEILNEKNSDWTLQIGVINYLRRVQKFDKIVFGQFFYGNKMYPKILDLINSVRSSVSKNALLLLNEIFSAISQENKDSLLDLIKATLPLLIPKINSKQSFIKEECKQLLELMSQNVIFPEILLIILQQMNNSYKAITNPHSRNKDKESEILSDFFIKTAKCLGKEKLLDIPQFNEIIKSLVSFYDLSRNNNGKFCKNILDCLIEIMEKENFYAKIENCGKKEKEKVENIIAGKTEDNTKKMRATLSSQYFRTKLKEKKKSLKVSKGNDISFDRGNKSVSIKIMTKNKEAMIVNKKNNLIRPQHNDENVQKNN